MKREIYHIAHHMPPPGGGRYATTGDISKQARFQAFVGTRILTALLGYVAPAGVWFKCGNDLEA